MTKVSNSSFLDIKDTDWCQILFEENSLFCDLDEDGHSFLREISKGSSIHQSIAQQSAIALINVLIHYFISTPSNRQSIQGAHTAMKMLNVQGAPDAISLELIPRFKGNVADYFRLNGFAIAAWENRIVDISWIDNSLLPFISSQQVNDYFHRSIQTRNWRVVTLLLGTGYVLDNKTRSVYWVVMKKRNQICNRCRIT